MASLEGNLHATPLLLRPWAHPSLFTGIGKDVTGTTNVTEVSMIVSDCAPKNLLGTLRALPTKRVHEPRCPNKAGQAFLGPLWCIIPICHPFLFGPSTQLAMRLSNARPGSASLWGRDTSHPCGLSELPVFRKCQGEILKDSLGIRVRGPMSPPRCSAWCFPTCHCCGSSQGGSKSQMRRLRLSSARAVDRARLDVQASCGAGGGHPNQGHGGSSVSCLAFSCLHYRFREEGLFPLSVKNANNTL